MPPRSNVPVCAVQLGQEMMTIERRINGNSRAVHGDEQNLPQRHLQLRASGHQVRGARSFPIYRLEWQGVGSLQWRMRGCMTAVRAEPYAYDAREWITLELFLMQRAAGLPIETPALRP